MLNTWTEPETSSRINQQDHSLLRNEWIEPEASSRIDTLSSPNLQYRGVPFWSWNDDITPEEARRQIRDLAAAGFGGFFIHARSGLKTPYMGDTWMDCIEACVEESRLVGIKTWLYDENGYPSGFAGGNVPKRGLPFQQKHLHFEKIPAGDCVASAFLLGHFRCVGHGERVDPAMLAPEEPVLRATFSVNPYYSDLLNPDATSVFIEESYEPYYCRFGQYFGKEISGIFTDEPQLGRTGMPWSHVLPAYFLKRYGYDLLDKLSALSMKTEGFETVRHDYWQCVTDLFINGYIAPLRQWCDDHHCLLTGHVLLEEDIRRQILSSGSAMAMYRHMHIPGVDWLGRNTGNPFLLRQVVSVAAQTGSPLVLSEMFAAAGWNTTPEELKHIAEWQYAFGINLLCAHLYAYSISGNRKKDHPPVISFQANWWEAIRPLNDHLARLGQLLSEGVREAELLVVHPLRGGWATLDASCSEHETNPDMQALEEAGIALENALSHAWVDHDYADEGMLEELGRVESEWLHVGAQRYRVVLIPETTVLEEKTIRMLNTFAGKGGVIWRMGEMPCVARLPAGDEAESARQQLTSASVQMKDTCALLAAARAAGLAPFSVERKDGSASTSVVARHVRYGDEHVLFLVNMDEENRFDGRVFKTNRPQTTAANRLEAQQVDLLTLSATPMPVTIGGVPVSLEPAGSLLLFLRETDVLANQKDSLPEETTEADRPMVMEVSIPPMEKDWQIDTSSENYLLLDTCRYSTSEGVWSDRLPVCQVQNKLLAGGQTVQVRLRFELFSELDAAVSKDCNLIVEHAESMEVWVNGHPVHRMDGAWWKEPMFGRFSLSGQLQVGRNEIELQTTFLHSPALRDQLERAKVFEAEMNMLTYLTELENIFIAGPFRVMPRGRVTKHMSGCFLMEGPFVLQPPAKKTGPDLTTDGLPFFTGKITVSQEFTLPDSLPNGQYIARWHPDCAWSEIEVNGTVVKRSLWAPHEADISAFVHGGVNRVGLTLVSTDRNVFGPHHHPQGELLSLGPVQFTDAHGWLETYSVMPFGPGTLDIVWVTGR